MKPPKDETAKPGDTVASDNQSGGITAHTVNKGESLIGDLNIDNVEQLNVIQVGDGRGFKFETQLPPTERDTALVDFNPKEMLATGSPSSLTASANVSAVTTFSIIGSSEVEIEFFNQLDGNKFDVTSSPNTPEFTVSRIDSRGVRLRFDGDVPEKLGIRIDSKPWGKK